MPVPSSRRTSSTLHGSAGARQHHEECDALHRPRWPASRGTPRANATSERSRRRGREKRCVEMRGCDMPAAGLMSRWRRVPRRRAARRRRHRPGPDPRSASTGPPQLAPTASRWCPRSLQARPASAPSATIRPQGRRPRHRRPASWSSGADLRRADVAGRRDQWVHDGLRVRAVPGEVPCGCPPPRSGAQPARSLAMSGPGSRLVDNARGSAIGCAAARVHLAALDRTTWRGRCLVTATAATSPNGPDRGAWAQCSGRSPLGPCGE